MKRFETVKLWLFAAACALFATNISADTVRGPVVVELYTSQGCSACPPADKLLHALAARDDVIALALHVDYWDYIGWKDIFARPEHTARQRGFAARAGKSMVYTPQMVIDGVAQVVGNKPVEVSELVTKHAQALDPVEVSIARENGAVVVQARGVIAAPADVHVVRFDPEQSVDITRGENRGKTISYANVVRAWDVIATWDGQAPLRLTMEVSGDAPLAVLIQAQDHGPILGAAALR